MMGLRPLQGNLRLVFRLFKSYDLRLNNLKTSLKFPCVGLNPIIDSISLKAEYCEIDLDVGDRSREEI